MAVITTITFQDQGQDFLEWDLSAKGKVVECRPFQGFHWNGRKVHNHKELQVGGFVIVSTSATSNGRMQIKYPIVDIERTER